MTIDLCALLVVWICVFLFCSIACMYMHIALNIYTFLLQLSLSVSKDWGVQRLRLFHFFCLVIKMDLSEGTEVLYASRGRGMTVAPTNGGKSSWFVKLWRLLVCQWIVFSLALITLWQERCFCVWTGWHGACSRPCGVCTCGVGRVGRF